MADSDLHPERNRILDLLVVFPATLLSKHLGGDLDPNPTETR
jgi:hypothetical protein